MGSMTGFYRSRAALSRAARDVISSPGLLQSHHAMAESAYITN
jgi:hypothetical protein